MGDRLTDMRVFTRVARLESFAGAARELRMSSTAVSRRVSDLENALEAQLLQRTTRRLSLTPAGEAYLARAESILLQLDELDDEVRGAEASASGVLRVAAGFSFAQEQIAPLLPDLLARHPDLTVELELSDRTIDLVAEGIDVAVRIGKLEDSGLVARRLATSRLALVASPRYLEQHGRPDSLDALHDHACLIDRNQPRMWRFEGGGRFEPTSRLRVNSAHAVLEAASRGLGIGLVPTFVSGPAIAAGRVEALLPDIEPEPSPPLRDLPAESHLSTRVRVFIDFLIDRFGDPPSWEAWRDGVV